MTETNLAQFDRFLRTLNTKAITEEDFEEKMGKVVSLVKQLIDNNTRAISVLEGKTTQIDQKFSQALQDLKEQTNQLFVKEKLGEMSTEQKKLFNALKGEFAILIDKKLGELNSEVKRRAVQGKQGERGIPGRPPTQEEIGLAFEPTVKDFKEAWEDKVQEVMRTRPSGGPNANAIQRTDLSSQCDGSKKTFTVPSFRYPVLLTGSQFPFIYRETVDYTIGRGTITMTDEVAPVESGQSLKLIYVK